MKLKESIEKIKEYSKENFINSDQYKIYENILKNINSDFNRKIVLDILLQPIKVGLTFDESPTIKTDYINILIKNNELSFNGLDKKENFLIIGENYDALLNLTLTLSNQIGVIYIDPPYNTKDLLGKKYKDKFTKNAWLNLFKERIEVSKKLLSDDGIIFISIDDNMYAYLKVLCDEIFGELNFICTLNRKTSASAQHDEKNIAITSDYILVYSKNLSSFKINETKKNNWENYKFKDEYYNDRGYYAENKLDRGSINYSVSLDYPICYENEIIYAGGVDEQEWKKRKIKSSKTKTTKDWCWRWSKEKFKENLSKGYIIFKKKNNKTTVYYKQYQYVNNSGNKEIRTIKRNSFSLMNNNFTNDFSNKELQSIFGERVFEFPKSTELLKYLIDFHPNKEIIVLDFFAGSGSTAHATMSLNKEDGGNRRYIIITNNEQNIAKNVCYERLYRINKGKNLNGISDFNWKNNNNPFNCSLNVFELKKIDASLKNDFDIINNIDISPYSLLNPNITITNNNKALFFQTLLNHLTDKEK